MGSTVWSEEPYTCLQKDMITRDQKSKQHEKALLVFYLESIYLRWLMLIITIIINDQFKYSKYS